MLNLTLSLNLNFGGIIRRYVSLCHAHFIAEPRPCRFNTWILTPHSEDARKTSILPNFDSHVFISYLKLFPRQLCIAEKITTFLIRLNITNIEDESRFYARNDLLCSNLYRDLLLTLSSATATTGTQEI